MKRILLTLALILSAVGAYAADITPITDAFKKGNATAIQSQMDQEVDVALPGASKKANAADAVAMLNTFFNTNKPSGFNLLHHADKKENGFFVAKLPTAGKEFRVNITYRADGDKAIIQSIRIE
ncbi:DUF4783 domain-containing protein [Parabacteroides sp. PFB2-10]|uniref:DUF4783 domain-containing protein n=1 Tax=Parabacteroides sp. PFB2-10 TaxID=1742405 RepID=UPI0024758212|nr:DUF4783 domain-containing protein [Parabacteroides sp. PFB2-10]MDL2244429.1 DUF4783 domain-containing protein [Parabacteroides sp. OttesenSCG-928-J18]